MAYIGQSLVEGTRRVYNYTATASQTTFHAVYQVGVVDVYKNGLLLAPDTYTATDGVNIVLDTGASAGDTIAIHCHNTFSVTDTVPASGGSFTGDVTMQGNLNVQGTTTTLDSASAQTVDLGDNDKIRLGDGNDLEIYHDGSNSNIKDAGTGPLKIFATDLYINNSAGNKTHISGIDGGAVTLFHNGASKLATTSTGVDVTGTVTPDNISIGGGTTASYKQLVIESSSDAAGIGLNGGTGSGVDYEIQSAPSGNFLIYDRDNTRYLYNATGTNHDWYTSGGIKMTLDTNGHLGIGTTSPADTSWGHATYGNTEVAIDGGGGYGILHLRGDGAGSTEARYSMGVGDGNFYMAYDDVAGNHRMTMNANGQLGIGRQPTSSYKLDLHNSLSGNWLAHIHNSHATNGYGVKIRAGDDNNVSAFRVSSQDNNTTILECLGGGAVQKPNQPSFLIMKTNGAVTTSSVCVFNSVQFDTTSSYSTSTGRYTAPVSGKYLISVLGIAGEATGTEVNGEVQLRKNGSRIQRGHFNHSDRWENVSYSMVVNMNANDYVDVFFVPNHGSPELYGSGDYTMFSGFLIG